MEAKDILDEAKREADQVLKQARALQLEADKAKKIKEMEEARRKLNEKAKHNSQKLSESMFSAKESYKAPKSLKLGEDVEIVAMHQVGTVVTLPDDKGDFMIKVGIMKLKTNLKDVRRKKEETTVKSKKIKSASGGGTISKTMSLSSEVDVRGETVDTAVVIIDKFLDDALMSSLSQVRIIHGKGTGQLRAGIHAYLKRLSYVKSYRLGTFGEGDSGVTVVEFK